MTAKHRVLLAVLMMCAATGAARAQDSIADNWDSVSSLPASFESSEGAALAGEIWLPSGPPTAGLVLVHGSDVNTRLSDFARLFATQGFAVLTYDKRGNGESGGELPGPYNVSPVNLDLMTDDAAAAMTWLAARPELDSLPVGYWGISQAGWIAPEAAARTAETDFLVMWSATAMSVADELEDGLAEGENAENAQVIRDFIAELRTNGDDPDPVPAIAAFGRPSLWIYGTADVVVPVPLALAALEPMIADGHTEIEIRMNEGGGHNLDLSRDRGTFDAMVEWIRAQPDSTGAAQ